MRIRTVRPAALAVLALALASFAGCDKHLSVNHTYDLKPGDVRSSDFDAFPNDITATVEFTSTAADVTASLFRKSDLPDLKQIDLGKALEKRTGKGGTFAPAARNGRMS
jgi:hypothetical protein